MERVIIADHNHARSGKLRELVVAVTGKKTSQVKVWEQLQHGPEMNFEWQMLIIAFDLPCKSHSTSPNYAVRELVRQLEGLRSDFSHLKANAPIILLLDNPKHVLPSGLTDRLNIQLVVTPKREIDAEKENELRALISRLLHVEDPPQITLEGDIRLLRNQLLVIDSRGNLEIIKAVLVRMIRKFRKGCSKAVVRPMTAQGKSGSLVLDVTVSVNGKRDERWVMKISPKVSRREIQLPPAVWQELEKDLTDNGLTASMPPRIRTEDTNETLITDGQLIAEASQFVDSRRDWEYLYLSASTEIPFRAEPSATPGIPGERLSFDLNLLADSIALLREKWYDQAIVETHALWEALDAPHDRVWDAPPYRLSDSWKNHIIAALPKLDVMGRPLFQKSWDGYKTCIRTWIERGPPEGSKAYVPQPVVLSKIHGDLNRTNLSYYLSPPSLPRAFLIDFPTFQVAGHTLLDFTNLEAEVMLGMMDGEHQHPIPARDFYPDQVFRWLELEKWLRKFATAATASANTPKARELELTLPESWGLRHALEAIQLIRSQAQEVHLKAHGTPALMSEYFRNEYMAALLYHTLRFTAYGDSVPMPKRILAVVSACRLIEELQAMHQ